MIRYMVVGYKVKNVFIFSVEKEDKKGKEKSLKFRN